MTFEQAKQQIAENYGLDNWETVCDNSFAGSIEFKLTEAAELWNSENLARNKELETGLKLALKDRDENLKEIERLKNVGIGFVNRIEKQRQRVEELEAGLKKIANTSDDAPQMMRVIAKQLLK